ncbi:hypothetical protein AB0P36_34560 [Streptomyces flavidovirens]
MSWFRFIPPHPQVDPADRPSTASVLVCVGMAVSHQQPSPHPLSQGPRHL